MKKVIHILIAVLLFGVIPSASAQFGKQKKADALYNSFSFVKAIDVYKEMVANNYNVDYAKRRLADSYAMLRDPQNASAYYAEIVKQPKVDSEYYLKYALALRGLEKI